MSVHKVTLTSNPEEDFYLDTSDVSYKLKRIFKAASLFCIPEVDDVKIEILWQKDKIKQTVCVLWDFCPPEYENQEIYAHHMSLWCDRELKFAVYLQQRFPKLVHDAFQGHAMMELGNCWCC